MKTVKDIYDLLHRKSPFSASESWDNTGLLVGDENWKVSRIYVALDPTDEVIAHAASEGADLLVTHHPLLFSPIKKLVAADFIGRRIIALIEHKMAYIAMHTNYDIFGMADLAAQKLGLSEALPLDKAEVSEYPVSGCYDAPISSGSSEAATDGMPPAGIGRVGVIRDALSLEDFSQSVKRIFGLSHVRFFGEPHTRVHRVAVCPGSGKSMISLAVAAGADVFLTGDIDHHSGLDALSQGLCIVDAGHYGIEHIFIEDVAAYLKEALSGEIEIITEAFKEPIQIC